MSSTSYHKYERWLRELTALPTAAGREDRVVDWVSRWAKRRRGIVLAQDAFGNLELRCSPAVRGRPIYWVAHMDHPAFVVDQIKGRHLFATFRGGVGGSYFRGSPVLVHTPSGSTLRGIVRCPRHGPGPDRAVRIELEGSGTVSPVPGDVATWNVGAPRVGRGRLWTLAADNLAGVASALSAFDALQGRDGVGNVRVLLTRCEEIGFVGAIAAAKSGQVPRSARIIVLENSKSLVDSPLGGGPIVRVGDRASTFDPNLTYQLGQVAEQLVQRDPDFLWQRRLMSVGTCEATAFCAFGYTAACLCLPLENYHNMQEESGRIAPESISLRDFRGLVQLLVATGLNLNDVGGPSALRSHLSDIFLRQRHLLRRSVAQ